MASARALSDEAKRQLLRDVNAISGPRTVEWDSEILCAPNEETIESTATARGFESAAWASAIRQRIARLGRVAVTGRTFALAPNH